MQIAEEMLPQIEKYLGIKLNVYQKCLLLTDFNRTPIMVKNLGRTNGKLFTECFINVLYHRDEIELDLITNERAKACYKECLGVYKIIERRV